MFFYLLAHPFVMITFTVICFSGRGKPCPYDQQYVFVHSKFAEHK